MPSVDVDDILMVRLERTATDLGLWPAEVLRHIIASFYGDLDARLIVWGTESAAFLDPRFCFNLVNGPDGRFPNAEDLLSGLTLHYVGIQRRKRRHSIPALRQHLQQPATFVPKSTVFA